MVVPRSTSEAHPLERRVAQAAARRDAALDDAFRGRLGVVHTPARLCRYVLARADAALRGAGIAEGIADPALTIADPAVGPGAFLASAIALGARGRLLGFERDPDALGAAREALGDRVELVLGDTLAALPELSGPLLVVGNPPWVGGWAKEAGERALTDRLLDDFRRDVTGAPLAEKKVGVLSDAYVRFVRWSAEVVLRAERGALALVTNASFLDGPVHRGMRGFLWDRFDSLEVTDLGGSALIARSGDRDENVFGVRPGVAVTVAARGTPGQDETSLSYARLRGTRESKLAALDEAALERAPLSPRSPELFFVPTGRAFPEGWLPLPALFPFHREGVQTNRDAVVIDRDRDRLLGRMQAFALGLARPDLAKAELARSHYDPEVARAAVREALAADPEGRSWIHPIAYRPFERRWYVDRTPLCHRPRPALAAALAHGGWALASVRKDRGERAWNHVAATAVIVDNCYFSSRSSCRTRAFPRHDPSGAPNLSERARALFTHTGEAFAYALAVLSAAPYRERFDDALRRDYPRLPPPSPDALAEIVPLGDALAAAFVAESRDDDDVAVGHRAVVGPSAVTEGRRRCDRAVAAWLAALE